MESFPIDTLPTAGDIHMACFTAVKNAPDLKEKLQNQDKSLTFAIVESNLVRFFNPTNQPFNRDSENNWIYLYLQ
jgi:hypothetical protein